MKKELVDIAAELHHETDGAYLLWDGRTEIKKNGGTLDVKVWVPKSMVENNKDGTWTMPEWLAKDKGFI